MSLTQTFGTVNYAGDDLFLIEWDTLVCLIKINLRYFLFWLKKTEDKHSSVDSLIPSNLTRKWSSCGAGCRAPGGMDEYPTFLISVFLKQMTHAPRGKTSKTEHHNAGHGSSFSRHHILPLTLRIIFDCNSELVCLFLRSLHKTG